MTPVRVGLFAHRTSPPNPTGIARYVRELVGALARVTDPAFTLALASTREQRPTDWVPAGVELRVVRGSRRMIELSWALGAGPRVERALGEPDVVHLTQPFPPVRSAAPQIVTVHDLFPLEHPAWYPRSERLTHRRSLALQQRRGAHMVVPSRYVADGLETLLEMPRHRIDVTPLGVSGVFERPRDDRVVAETCARHSVSPGEYAVCVGAVSARKNLIPVIRAFAGRRADLMPLLLIGPDGHGFEVVDSEVRSLSQNVRRTGFLSDSEVAALVAGACAVVHPALAEGFGFVPLEAMAAGVPVIAGRVGSIPEVVGDAAVLVDAPAEPAAWAAAVIEMRSRTGRREELVAAGLRRAAAFTWERSARELLAIYEKVAERP